MDQNRGLEILILPQNGQGNQFRGQRPPQKGQQPQNSRNFHQNRYQRPFPEAPYPPKNAKPAPKGGYPKRPPPDKNTQAPYKWNHDELGIAKFTCYRCGQPKKYCKGYWDNNCPYDNTPMCKTRCRATPCSGGCHKSSYCLGVIHNAVAALKKQQTGEKASKNANLVQEDPKTEIEDQDFFEDIEDQEEEFFDLNL